MDDKLKYWNQCCTPPGGALKKIKGGRLSGMTDINPQWRMRIMTEMFGPVGEKWWWTLDDVQYHQGTENQIVVMTQVSVRYMIDDKNISEPIRGIGGSMFIVKEKNGLRTNDEAVKMAVTDALSYAFKQIGIGADIYMGMMDGSKYHYPPPDKKPPQQEEPPVQQNGNGHPAGLYEDLPEDLMQNMEILIGQMAQLGSYSAVIEWGKDNKENFITMLGGEESPVLDIFRQKYDSYLRSFDKNEAQG